MAKRFTQRIGDHLKTPEQKRYYTERLFDEVAPRYDFITRALSFWRDKSWKRHLVTALPFYDRPVCVDLACGTGDIVGLLARRYREAHVVGLDLTDRMLDIARRRNGRSNVWFVRQDMGNLGIASESVDIVTGGYALRNAPDLAVTLEEIHRVLKPEGVAAFLDFSRPRAAAAQRVEYWLLKLWTGFWGLLLHRNAEVYGYIAESLQCFPDRFQLRDILRDEGFTVTGSRLGFFGVVELLVVRKAAQDRAGTTGPLRHR